MNTRQKVEIAVASILVIILISIAVLWVREREARIRAEATSQALDQQKKQSETVIQTIQQQMAERDEETSKQIQSLANLIGQVKTTQEAIQAVPRVSIQPLPAQPYVVQTQPTAQAPEAKQGDVVIPQASAFQMWQQYSDDVICRSELKTAQADLDSDKQILAQKESQLNDANQKAQTWEKTAKGGTKTQRFFRAVKQVAIGIAVGAVLKTIVK